MNRKILKGFIFSAALLLVISGCATVKNFAGFFGFADADKESATGKNFTAFVNSIRPVQGNPDSHYTLARYYQDRGNHAAAIKEFEKTIAIDPKNVMALNAMGVSYDYLKAFESAADCYQAALKLDPNSAKIYQNNMGQSLLLQGKYSEAIEAFKKAAAYDKGVPDARVHNNLGRAYALAGKQDLALAEFKLASSKAVSAEKVLQTVLQTASVTAAVKAEDETTEFVAGVSKFLHERNAAVTVSSNTVTPVPAPQKQPTPVVVPDVRFGVSNGNGIKFSARDTGDYLAKKGFRVASVNEGIRVNGTYIYYKEGYEKDAGILARHLPVEATIKKVSSFRESGIDVKLLVGWDMAQQIDNPSKKPAEIVPARVTKPAAAVEVVKADVVKKTSPPVVSVQQRRSVAAPARKEAIVPVKVSPKQSAAVAVNNIGVEVSNGNGVKYSARNAGDYLMKKGFRVAKVNDGGYVSRTFIYYKEGHEKEARMLAQHIPVAAKFKKMTRVREPEIKVRLLVGEDMEQLMRGPSKKAYTLNSRIGA